MVHHGLHEVPYRPGSSFHLLLLDTTFQVTAISMTFQGQLEKAPGTGCAPSGAPLGACGPDGSGDQTRSVQRLDP
jgi:hypothetical protein